MSAISDLQNAESNIATALTSLGTTVQSAVTLIQNFQNGTVNADDPQVEAVVTKLQGDLAAIQSAAGTLSAAVTPAPAAPAPTAPSSPAPAAS